MSKTTTLTMTVRVTVDLDAWATAYGFDTLGGDTLRDAEGYLPDLAQEYLLRMPHYDEGLLIGPISVTLVPSEGEGNE